MIKKILKYIFIILSLFILFCIYSLGKTFIYNDITVEPIYHSPNVNIGNNKHIMQLPVYLVSYASGKEIWYKNQNALAFSSLNKGIDVIINYNKSHLSTEFLQK